MGWSGLPLTPGAASQEWAERETGGLGPTRLCDLAYGSGSEDLGPHGTNTQGGGRKQRPPISQRGLWPVRAAQGPQGTTGPRQFMLATRGQLCVHTHVCVCARVCACTSTHIQMCTHAYCHTCTMCNRCKFMHMPHRCAHLCARMTCTRLCVCVRVGACMCLQVRVFSPECTHTYTLALARTRNYTHAHIPAHTRVPELRSPGAAAPRPPPPPGFPGNFIACLSALCWSCR